MSVKQLFYKICLITLLVPVSLVHAEIIIHGTRVVYPSDAREVTLQLSNDGESPSLVQVWIDEGDPSSTPDQSKAPFILTPPISRVEGQKSQFIRITSLPIVDALSKTEESLFWLNVLDIPPKPSTSAQGKNFTPDNFLQLAVRSRIKLFYRPSDIKQNVTLAPEKIQWRSQDSSLLAKNPTPFYITITSITQESAGETIDILSEGLMLKPFSEQSVLLKSPSTQNMTFTTINDYGGRVIHKIK